MERLHAIGEFLATLEADVIALQEVALASRDGDLVDNAGDLARQLGMEVRYGAARTFEITGDDGVVTGAGCFGNALLSRLPIRSSRAIMLPMAASDAYIEPPGADHSAAGVRYAEAPDGTREPRTLVLGEVAGMTVGSAHLSHIGSGERALQVDACLAALGSGPALLLGDLNAPIESPELAALGGLVDGFAAADVPPGDSRRVSTDDGWSIDHVLARGATIRGCRVVREAGDLSDHFPVVADVTAG